MGLRCEHCPECLTGWMCQISCRKPARGARLLALDGSINPTRMDKKGNRGTLLGSSQNEAARPMPLPQLTLFWFRGHLPWPFVQRAWKTPPFIFSFLGLVAGPWLVLRSWNLRGTGERDMCPLRPWNLRPRSSHSPSQQAAYMTSCSLRWHLGFQTAEVQGRGSLCVCSKGRVWRAAIPTRYRSPLSSPFLSFGFLPCGFMRLWEDLKLWFIFKCSLILPQSTIYPYSTITTYVSLSEFLFYF